MQRSHIPIKRLCLFFCFVGHCPPKAAARGSNLVECAISMVIFPALRLRYDGVKTGRGFSLAGHKLPPTQLLSASLRHHWPSVSGITGRQPQASLAASLRHCWKTERQRERHRACTAILRPGKVRHRAQPHRPFSPRAQTHRAPSQAPWHLRHSAFPQ